MSGDETPCQVTPVILHGPISGDTTPCKVTPVILHGVVFPENAGSGCPPEMADAELGTSDSLSVAFQNIRVLTEPRKQYLGLGAIT